VTGYYAIEPNAAAAYEERLFDRRKPRSQRPLQKYARESGKRVSTAWRSSPRSNGIPFKGGSAEARTPTRAHSGQRCAQVRRDLHGIARPPGDGRADPGQRHAQVLTLSKLPGPGLPLTAGDGPHRWAIRLTQAPLRYDAINPPGPVDGRLSPRTRARSAQAGVAFSAADDQRSIP